MNGELELYQLLDLNHNSMLSGANYSDRSLFSAQKYTDGFLKKFGALIGPKT